MRRLLVLVCLLGFASSAAGQVTTSYVEMGLPVAGAWSVRPLAINDSGLVVAEVGSPDGHAFTWDPAAEWRSIGKIGRWTSMRAVNNAGLAVGLNLTDAADRNDGIVWDAAGGMRVMNGFGDNGVFSSGINDAGQVVGHSWMGPFVWTAAAGPTPLALAAGYLPVDINNAGQILAQGNGAAIVHHPTNGDVTVPALGSHTAVTAINERGQVVGYAAIPGVGTHAFFWDPATGIVNLGAFGPYPDFEGNLVEYSYATGLNEHGQVVGFTSTSEGERAFIWDAVNGMRQLVATPYVRPTDINDAGQIVGTYFMPSGHYGGFYATVPLPAPPTPQEQVEQIGETIAALVAAGDLPANVGAALTAGLTLVTRSLERGNERAAEAQLRVMILGVNVLVRLNRIAPDDGATLTAALNEVIAGL